MNAARAAILEIARTSDDWSEDSAQQDAPVAQPEPAPWWGKFLCEIILTLITRKRPVLESISPVVVSDIPSSGIMQYSDVSSCQAPAGCVRETRVYGGHVFYVNVNAGDGSAIKHPLD